MRDTELCGNRRLVLLVYRMAGFINVDHCTENATEIIVKSFKKCGISNALDGTEDDALF